MALVRIVGLRNCETSRFWETCLKEMRVDYRRIDADELPAGHQDLFVVPAIFVAGVKAEMKSPEKGKFKSKLIYMLWELSRGRVA